MKLYNVFDRKTRQYLGRIEERPCALSRYIADYILVEA